jgi:D-galactarolactone isomerase
MQTMSRRKFIGVLGAGSLAAALPIPGTCTENWSSGSNPPAFRLPEGAVDCHMHIYDDRFPSAPGTQLRPPNASIGQYRQIQARLGIRRNVVVNPSTYGTDNSCMLDALKKFGPDARGIAVVDTSVTDVQLAEMDRAGVRGIRFNLSYPGATTIDMLAPLASRIAPLGWHIELVVQGAKLPALEQHLQALPCPLVIDHIAHIPQPDGLTSEAMKTARRLVDRGNTWITLSGPYVDTKAGAPAYADVAPVSLAFVEMAPERMLWGTDWPHPTEKRGKPDDAALVDVIASWIGRSDWQRMIFATNPAKLYGFPPHA